MFVAVVAPVFLLAGCSFATPPTPRAEAPLVTLADGLTVRFGVDGVQLQRGEDTLLVRAGGWGRVGKMLAPGAPTPRRSACDAGPCATRVEYATGSITEWWQQGPRGLEQGWTVPAPPPGHGDLTVDVDIEGADVVVRDREAWLFTGRGAMVRVSGLYAEDADGTALVAHLEPRPGGFRVRVEDAGARWPIVIDPVYAAAGRRWTGAEVNANFGTAVAGAGDVNGDGYDDVVVGAWGASDTAGGASVFLGGPFGPPSAPAVLLSAPDTLLFGASVDSAGDVNADGYADVIVGGEGYDDETLGSAHVFLGSAGGTSATPASTWIGRSEGSRFGGSVTGAGDVDGDGFDDVLIGAAGTPADPGWAYVHLGSPDGVDAEPATTLTGEHADHEFGGAVSGAGDVNGDGYADVVAGAAGYNTDRGWVYVYQGSAMGIPDVEALKLTGESVSDGLGTAVAGVGDLDADGFADVVVSGDRTSGRGHGLGYVHLGTAAGLSSVPASRILREDSDEFASSLGGAGDLDADGHDDLVIGATSVDTARGEALVYAGASGGISTEPTTVFAGTHGDEHFASAVGRAGDVNGDGFADLLVGAPGAEDDPYGPWGAAYLFFGCAGTDGCVEPDADGDGYGAAFDCDDTDATRNGGATEACDDADVDEDCDGAADDADTDAIDKSAVYRDGDGDGYGDGAAALDACEPPEGYVADASDCNDVDAGAHPDATEVPDDGIDQDCDGADAAGLDTPEEGGPAGCGCDATGLHAGWLLVLMAGLSQLRRRRAPLTNGG